MHMRKYIAIFLAAGVLSVAAVVRAADNPVPDGYLQVRSLIHLDSSVSGGENDPETLAAIARNAGADAAFITDHDTQKVTLGIWPLRNILKVSVTRPSIRTYGIEKYLKYIRDINSRTSGCIMIPGVEAVPYYSWERQWNGPLTLANLHRHILVLGLDKADDIAHLPSLETGFSSSYTRESMFGLVWLLPFIAALFIVTLPREKEPFETLAAAIIHSTISRVAAFSVMGMSVLFLVNAYPFREPLVSQYGPDKKKVPYQELIDYVNARGGLTFWAHPEAEYSGQFGSETGSPLTDSVLKFVGSGGIRIKTEPYFPLLNDTYGYTGFAVFYEGYRVVGKPEGLWDMLLMQYCTGRREHPVWAISELKLESGTDPVTASDNQTILLVREKSEKAYLDALKKGRMYAFTRGMARSMMIRDYSVISGATRAISGEVIDYGPDARLVFAMDVAGNPLDLEIAVVVDGRLADRRKSQGTTAFELPLKLPDHTLGYVRIVIYEHGEMVAVTNPIFLNSRVTK